MNKLYYSIVIVAIAFVLSACASSSPPTVEASAAPKFADEYLIGIGDGLQVSVWRNPELSVAVPVRPDGRITVPVAGDISVGGLTPEAVSEVIASELKAYIRDPIVTVIVTNTGSGEYISRVRVTGAVGSPASMPFRPGMTVLDIILDAGGVTTYGKASGTTLYRRTGERLSIRLDRILKKGDMSTNVYVQPGDIITVPESLF